MSFFRVLIILSLMLLANKSFADESTQKQKVLDQTKEIAKQLEEDDEVPLNLGSLSLFPKISFFKSIFISWAI